jgi:predicted nucleotidyltransferase
MNPNDPNVVLLEHVAQRLDAALRDELVFVGGAVAGLLITDPAHPAIRPTRDVDLIVRVVTRRDYYGVEQRLSALGFTRDLSAEAPICRWRIDGTVIVDVMPTLDEILGFANRWYPLALDTALSIHLPSGTPIRLIAPPAFLATKLEAFAGRGAGDYLFSHDLGDAISLIDGRVSLVDECRAADVDLRAYLADCWRALLDTPAFIEALPGHLPGDAASQERLPDLIGVLEMLASLI